jgi:hypothetical protein
LLRTSLVGGAVRGGATALEYVICLVSTFDRKIRPHLSEVNRNPGVANRPSV